MARPIVVPSMGMFTSEGTLTAWLRPAGARVEAGEPVAEITSEKATQEVTAPVAGVVYPVVAVGTTLAVQGLLGYVLAEGEEPPVGGTGPVPPASAASPAPGPATAALQPPISTGAVRATPVARRLAAEHQLDLATIVGTGPGGRIVEADVLAAVARRAATPAPSTAARPGWRVRTTIPLTGMRKTIAERLRSSLSTAVPVTLTREVDAEALVAARAGLSERLGRTVPYDALFVKIFADALSEDPTFNAVIENDTILVLEEIHVGLATALPTGLIVPVIHDAATRSLAEIVEQVHDLTERARASRLQPADVAGGTATITNLGNHGVDAFTPIVNPPQSAILGIGRILPRPIVRADQLAVGRTVFLSLTFDHRVADGVPAARLLDLVARRLADPVFLTGLVPEPR